MEQVPGLPDPEDGDTLLFRRVGNCLQVDTGDVQEELDIQISEIPGSFS
jgi:hypothetical protein